MPNRDPPTIQGRRTARSNSIRRTAQLVHFGRGGVSENDPLPGSCVIESVGEQKNVPGNQRRGLADTVSPGTVALKPEHIPTFWEETRRVKDDVG
jgi:hypothetical protein